MDPRIDKLMQLFRGQGLASAPAGASLGSRMSTALGSYGVPAPLAALPGAATDVVMHPGDALGEAPDFWLGKRRMKLHGEPPGGVQDPDYPG